MVAERDLSQSRFAEDVRKAREGAPAAVEALNADIAREVRNFHAWVESTHAGMSERPKSDGRYAEFARKAQEGAAAASAAWHAKLKEESDSFLRWTSGGGREF